QREAGRTGNWRSAFSELSLPLACTAWRSSTYSYRPTRSLWPGWPASPPAWNPKASDMRAIISAASLLVAVLSLAVDIAHPSPGSSLCRYGGCRFDQIFAGVDAAGDTPEAVSILVDADPANPLVWCA